MVPINNQSPEALRTHFQLGIRISGVSELPKSRVGNRGRLYTLLWRSLKSLQARTYLSWLFVTPSADRRTWRVLQALGWPCLLLPLTLLGVQLYASCTFSLPQGSTLAVVPQVRFILLLAASHLSLLFYGKLVKGRHCPINHIVWWWHQRPGQNTQRWFLSQPKSRAGWKRRKLAVANNPL